MSISYVSSDVLLAEVEVVTETLVFSGSESAVLITNFTARTAFQSFSLVILSPR